MRAFLCLLFAACASPATVTCADGSLCPGGTVCITDPGALLACALPAQVTACNDLDDTKPCSYMEGDLDIPGECHGHVCTTDGCGDGIIELGEVCDDGNRTDGDGCRGDCRKLEICGDGIVDKQETCDDHNANDADGCNHCHVEIWAPTTLLGGTPDAVTLSGPRGIIGDGRGHVFIGDLDNDRVLRLDIASGIITRVAGNEVAGFSGDYGPAASAQIGTPNDLALDGFGNLYIADTGNNAVRKVDALTGTITTVAGIGGIPGGTDGDGFVATAAHLLAPSGIAVDGLGNLYISTGQTVRRVDATTGIITRVAGTIASPGFSGDGNLATSAQLDGPTGLAFAPDGALLIVDTDNDRIRRIDPVTRRITTFAGNGGHTFFGDGGPATGASFARPTRIAADGLGGFAIADASNQRIRYIAPDRTIRTIAGNGSAVSTGDGGPATAAGLWDPAGVTFASPTELYIADTDGDRLRAVTAAGTITTVAGNGTESDGDGLPALATTMDDIYGIAFDPAGALYVSDYDEYRVRELLPDGTMTTVAGDGTVDGIAPRGIAFTNGALYVADARGGRIVKVGPAGALTTITSNVGSPTGIAADAAGNLFVADEIGNRVRRVDGSTHAVTIVAGTGTAGFGGDGAAATAAMLNDPISLAVDAAGDLYIVDHGNLRVRRIDHANGTIATVAGGGSVLGDGGPATAAALASPFGVAVDPAGNVVIGDAGLTPPTVGYRLRRIDAASGTISTIAGTGTLSADGDGGLATAATVVSPYALAFSPITGELYAGDYSSHRVRRIAADGTIATVAGRIDPRGVGPAATARLADPRGFVVTPALSLFAGGGSGVVEMLTAAGGLEAIIGRYPQTISTGTLARYRNSIFGAVGGVAYDEAAQKIYLTSDDKLLVVDRATMTIAFVNGIAFKKPTGLTLDAAAHTLYVADTGNHIVRAIDLGTMAATTVAGVLATRGDVGDGGAATAALLDGPEAVIRCAASGDLYIADTQNQRVQRVDTAGVISTVLGPGAPVAVDTPRGLACDDIGNLYVTSRSRLLQVEADTATHVADGSLPVHAIFGGGDTFPASLSNCLTGVAVIDSTHLQITDACAGLLVELARQPR